MAEVSEEVLRDGELVSDSASEADSVSKEKEQSSSKATSSSEVDPMLLEKARAFDQIVFNLDTRPYETLKEVAEREGFVLIDPKKEPDKLKKDEGFDFDTDLYSDTSSTLDESKVKELAKRAVEELEREKEETLRRAKKMATDAKAYIKSERPNFSAFEQVYDKLVDSLDGTTAKEVMSPGGITALLKEAELAAYRQGLLGRGGVPLSPVGGAPQGAEIPDEQEQLRIALGWSKEKLREIEKRKKELFMP